MRAAEKLFALVVTTLALTTAPLVSQTLTLTTNGTNGPATLSGSTLNIPVYLNYNGTSPSPFQSYIGTTNTGVTMDSGSPAYDTHVDGNVFDMGLFQNGLFNGVLNVAMQVDMLGDDNGIINSYRGIRGGTATPSDEGTAIGVVAHNYVNYGIGTGQYLMYQATVTSNTLVDMTQPYGPSVLVLNPAESPLSSIASTMLFDITMANSNTITAIYGSGGSTPYTATVSGTVSPSSSATLTTDLCDFNSAANQCGTFTETNALNPSPTLQSFTVTDSTALTPGVMCQFVDTNPNLAETTTLVSAPSSPTTGSQEVSAYLVYPHQPGTQMYCGGMVGYGVVFNADVHGGPVTGFPVGQMYGFHIYGSPTSTSLLIGDRTFGGSTGQYGNGPFAAKPGAVTIYPAATIISNTNPSSGRNDGTYALVVYPQSSFVMNDSVVNPGFANNTTYFDNYAAYLDDPYNGAYGFSYAMEGLGFNWVGAGHALYTYHLGDLAPMGSPVDFVTVIGADSIGTGFSFQSQFTGDVNIPDLGGHNCFFCLVGWDHSAGAKTDQEIFATTEGASSPAGAGILYFHDADFSLRYTQAFFATNLTSIFSIYSGDNISAVNNVTGNNLFDTSLGASTSPICTTTGGQLTNAGCSGGGVPSVNGITSAVTIAAGTGVSVGTSGSTVTVTNTEPLNASTLEGVLAASPYNISAASGCSGRSIFAAASPDGLLQCDPGSLNAGSGYWLYFNSGGTPGMQFDGGGSYVGLLSNQPSSFQSGLQLLGDDTTFDAGSGTEYIHNAAGGTPIRLVGAFGTGYFDGGVQAGNGNNAQLVSDASAAGYNNLTFNGNSADTTRLGLVGSSADPNLYIDVPSTGQFAFRIGSDTATVEIGVNGVSTPGLLGPASAPSGSCSTNGIWVFSQDGHATFCASGAWVTKI